MTASNPPIEDVKQPRCWPTELPSFSRKDRWYLRQVNAYLSSKAIDSSILEEELKMLKYLLCVVVAVGLIPCYGQQRHECMGTGDELGEALDIDTLDGKPVSLYGRDAEVTKSVQRVQESFNHPKDGKPAAAENFGPAGLFRDGKRFEDTRLQENHTDHIHIRVSPPSKTGG